MASPVGDELGIQSRLVQTAASWPSKRLLMKPAQRLAMLTTLPTRSELTRCDEVLEVEVDVIHAGAELGSEVVAQVLRVQVLEIGARLDEGAARLGHLLAVHGQEAVREDRGRGAEARAAQHGRPEQGVEVDDVLADEVVQLGLLSLPQ